MKWKKGFVVLVLFVLLLLLVSDVFGISFPKPSSASLSGISSSSSLSLCIECWPYTCTDEIATDVDSDGCYDYCKTDDECGPSFVCDTSVCVAECDENDCLGYACAADEITCGTSCTESSDCASGYVCDSDVCVAYCGIGDAECSNGEDDDSDSDGSSGIDYAGACTISGVTYSCSSLDGDEYDRDVDSSMSSSSCSSACSALSGTYIGGDDSCVSPLDPYEGTGTGATAYGAPEEEQGFWAKLLDFLFFWK